MAAKLCRVAWFFMGLLLLASPALATAVNLQLTGAGGERQEGVFDGFDDRRLVFVIKQGKQKHEVALSGLAALRILPSDTLPVAAPVGPWDIVTMRDGAVQSVIFRRMDDSKIHVKLATGAEASFAIASVRSVSFQPTILDVDRRQFGRGFNLFGTDVEVQVAALYAGEIESEVAVLDDPVVGGYVEELGQRLVEGCKRTDLTYQFRVLNSGQVNAFTVGGGKVYIYRGLLEKIGSESELAGVLAHEIGHVVGRHTSKQLSKTMLMNGVVAASSELAGGEKSKFGAAVQQVGGAIAIFKQLQYSRDDEREADYLSVYNLAAMGIDPQGMVSAFETLRRQQDHDPSRFEVFFQSHPSLEERIGNTSVEIARLRKPGQQQDSPAFHRMLDHLGTLPRPVVRVALVRDTADVPALERRHYTWKFDPTLTPNARVTGRFRAYGGAGNDIRMLVLDEVNYVNFINGHNAKAIYDSGTITVGEPVVTLGQAGTYHIVLDNKFSLMTDKRVILNLQLEYTE